MRTTIALLLLLPACLDDSEPGAVEPPPTCEQQVCAYVPDCSPLTAGEWDWRSEAACLDTFDCGPTPDRCLDAVMELPCLSTPPTWEELEANTRAMKLTRERCGAL